jgi:hypothetical protein
MLLMTALPLLSLQPVWAQELLWTAKSPFLKGVQTKPNMEPAIPHLAWDAEAAAKLAGLEKKTGRKPNFILFFVDDMGWGDPGVYGGGRPSALRPRISIGSPQLACA